MRIGISAIHVRPGKSGSHQPYLVNLVNSISGLETTHEFILFVTPANRTLFEKARGRMEFVIYPGISDEILPRIFLEQFRLPIDTYRKKIDVMHYPGNTASFFLRKSDVVTVHFDSVTQRNSLSSARKIYYDTVLLINKKAGRIIAPSHIYANELVKYFGYQLERIHPVYHGVSSLFRRVTKDAVEKTRAKYGIGQNAILTVTNTLPHKNIPNLIRAYNSLVTRHHLTNQLVMVGYIDECILMEIIAKITDDPQRLRSQITVIPFLPHEVLPPIYAASSVFVFYSRVETFGMPIVEAMACGLPVIASDIPIHREIVQNAGSLISPDDPDALADELHRVLINEEYRGALSQSALNWSKQYSWETTARQTIQVYEDSWNSRQLFNKAC